MKTDEALNPVDIDLFGSGNVAVEARNEYFLSIMD